jgi:hypothetical protein
MRTQIEYLFWGLLLVIVDVAVNGFDLLPDFIGYIVIASGCGGLLAVSPRFGTARTLSIALVGTSLLEVFARGNLPPAWTLVGFVLSCSMIWFLLGGLMDLTMQHQRPDLAEKAAQRRTAYIVLASLGTLGAMFAPRLLGDAPVLVLLLVVIMLVLVVMILQLIWQVRQMVVE